MTSSPSEFDRNEALLKHWYASIDAAVDSRRRVVAMVARVVPGPRIEAFGTGFFYLRDGVPFFVTAKHVLDVAVNSNQCGQRVALVTRGRKELIHILRHEFFVHAELDIAVAPLLNEPATAYSHVDFLTPDNLGSLLQPGLFAFTGFPASKNKTYTTQQLKPHQRVITFDRKSAEAADVAAYFLEFPIPRVLHKSDLSSIRMGFPDGLDGMSGGPAFTIGGTIDRPLLSVCGIGISWANRRDLQFLRFDVADAWLSQYKTW